MSVDPGLVGWVEEAVEALGRFSHRRMFGGAGLYLDGVIFAIVGDRELWFKSDRETDASFDASGCDRFTYRRGDGRVASMNYRRAPSEVYDDLDEMRRWAMLALDAGRRNRKD